MNTTTEDRRAFVERLKEAIRNPTNALFADVIGLASNDLTDEEMSNRFGVSRPTVNRWRNGKATPHPVIKVKVCQNLLDRNQKLLKSLARVSQPPMDSSVAAE